MSENHFKRLWNLGYKSLVPIIPPGSPISAHSSLYKRVGTHQDGRGKVPGVKGRDGNWFSFNWLPHETDENDLDRWHAMGAGVGVRLGPLGDGTSLIAGDADAQEEPHAIIIRDIFRERLGLTPVRVGRLPKALYLFRVRGDYPYTRLDFGPRDDKGNVLYRVEMLAQGQQFVAHGVHPGTLKPYSWPREMLAIDDLPIFDPEQIDNALLAMAALLPQAAPKLSKAGGDADVNQEVLRGDPDHVRRAVRATPNTTSAFPTRESYRDFGYAIKAALPDHPDEAFELYADWCDRWVDEHGRANDPDIYEADWRRMKPPFRVGASYLYEKAEKLSGGAFSRGEVWFAPAAENVRTPPMFDYNPGVEEEARNSTMLYPLLRIGDLMKREPPTFLIDKLIPQGGLGIFVAGPGAGKTFALLDMSLSISHGLPSWHGYKINPDGDGSVVYIAAEGSFDLPLRVGAWLTQHGIEDVSDKFLVLEQAVNFMDAESITKLIQSIEALGVRPTLVVVDTVSRALPGADENAQKDMTLFIAACERIQRKFRCAVAGAHHKAKAGGIRGSSVFEGASDFVILLEREKGASFGTMTMHKQKAEQDGWSRTFLLTSRDVDMAYLPPAFLAKKPVWGSLVFSLPDEPDNDAAGPVGPDLSALILDEMEKAWKAGSPWSMAPQSKKRYAVHHIVVMFNVKAVEAERMLKTWIEAGVIEMRLVDSHSKMTGLYVKRYGMDGAADVDVFG